MGASPSSTPQRFWRWSRNLLIRTSSGAGIFARGIEPLIVEYESILRDYRGEVARVLEFLGLDASVARTIPPPRLVRQADSLTHHWRRLLDNSVDNEELSR